MACSSPTVCTECTKLQLGGKYYYLETSASTCHEDSCPKGYYFIQGSGVCVDCPTEAAECNHNGVKILHTKCKSSYKLI